MLIQPEKKAESQILDYSSQQYLLFPQMACSFAMHFLGQRTKKQYDEYIC